MVARRTRIELGLSKDDFKAGATQLFDVVNADTVRSGEFFKDNAFDLIVTDAPYGVQHGSRTAGKGLVRSPEDLLAVALPVWTRLLRPGVEPIHGRAYHPQTQGKAERLHGTLEAEVLPRLGPERGPARLAEALQGWRRAV